MLKIDLPPSKIAWIYLNQPIFYSEKKIDPPFDLSFFEEELFPKFYWKSRDRSLEVMAFGALISLNELPDLTNAHLKTIRFYGGSSFDQKKDPLWKEFEKPFFILPLYEIIKKKNITTLIKYDFDKEDNPSIILKKTDPIKSAQLTLKRIHDEPNFQSWEKTIIDLLGKFERNELKKVVFGRKTLFEIQNPLSFSKIIENFNQKTNNCTLFAIILNKTKGFFGATPERLFHRKGGVLYTEALAATRKRGKTEQEDLSLEQDLIQNPKDLKEFSYVQSFLKKKLLSFGSKIAISPLELRKTPYLQHLLCRFSVNTTLSDKTFLKALHPTPAVGGVPRKKASQYLNENEPFTRGFYAAPIGWVSVEESEFVVGIRSFLIDKKSLHLFTAAGIVKGSIPLQEWEELEQKTNSILKGAFDE